MPSVSKTPRNRKAKRNGDLWLHTPTKQWCKKIGGKRFYFGTDRKQALARYRAEKDAILKDGCRPNENADATLADVLNAFLTAKELACKTGERAWGTFTSAKTTTDRLIAHFGKDKRIADLRPTDFDGYRAYLLSSRNLAPTTVAVDIAKVRHIFRWAHSKEVIDKPVRMGEFAKPEPKMVRRYLKNQAKQHGERGFTREQVLQLLEHANPIMKAQILLGINCGMGSSDISALPHSAIAGNWCEHARVKTEVDRRLYLWPETLQAIAEVPKHNPMNPADADLVFLTRGGKRYVIAGTSNNDLLARNFNNLLKQLGMKRPGLSFYALRHTFYSVADRAGDRRATDALMGHAPKGMGDRHYGLAVDDERLQAVAEHVRTWLFGGAK